MSSSGGGLQSLRRDNREHTAFVQWCDKEYGVRRAGRQQAKEFLASGEANPTLLYSTARQNVASGTTTVDPHANTDLPRVGRRFFKQAHSAPRLGFYSMGNPQPAKIAARTTACLRKLYKQTSSFREVAEIDLRCNDNFSPRGD